MARHHATEERSRSSIDAPSGPATNAIRVPGRIVTGSLLNTAPFVFNSAHTAWSAIKYGQNQLDNSDEMDLVEDRARYEADRAKDILLAGTRGIDAAMKTNQLDALLFPGGTGANIAARPGYPTVMVPFALVPNAPTPPFPAGFNAKPAPFGVSFTGMACSEPRLIELGFAFEQATKRRVPPPSMP